MQLGQKDAHLKAQLDDFGIKEKDLMRQVKSLEEDKASLEKSGAAKQQEVTAHLSPSFSLPLSLSLFLSPSFSNAHTRTP